MIEEKRFISLKLDLMFKKVFGDNKNKNPIKKLLKEILNIEATDVIILNQELIGRPYKDKNVRVDLIVELPDKTKVEVEVNTSGEQKTINRNVYYICRNISKDASPNRIPEKLHNHIQINLDYSGNHKKPIMRYELYDKEAKERLTDMIEIIRIDIPYFKDKCYNCDIEKLDSLTRFLGLFGAEDKEFARKISRGDKDMEDIYNRLEELNSDQDIMGIYDYKVVEEEAKEEEIEKAHLKGLEEGIASGKKIGFDDGQKVGFNNGYDKGTIQTLKETAKNMLKENIDLNIISKVTKLSKEELEKLK